MTETLNQTVELALITARGGSKGLPGKNIIDLAGKPLIVYTIDAALQSGLFKRVLVSTDDAAIAEVSRAAGAEVLIRPAELAQDDSSSLDVIEHALVECEMTAGHFCLLQPTSPFRNSIHITEAAKLFFEGAAKTLISVCKPNHHPLKSLIQKRDGGYKAIRELDDLESPRQLLPKAVAPNGAIYFSDVSEFLTNKTFFYDDSLFYEMSEMESLDIDTEFDIRLAKLIYIEELK